MSSRQQRHPMHKLSLTCFLLLFNYIQIQVTNGETNKIVTPLQRGSSGPKKFSVIGPVLTVTLKDPFAVERDQFQSNGMANPSLHGVGASAPENDIEDTAELTPESQKPSKRRRLSRFLRRSHTGPAHFLGLTSLAPQLVYTIKSNSPPLPKHIPALRYTSFTTSYRYDELKTKPSSIEADLKFHNTKTGLNLEIEPSYAVKEKHGHLVLRLGNESGGILTRITSRGKKILEQIRGSYKLNLPFTTVSSLSISPSYDFKRNISSCTMMGQSASGRTAALLDLNWDDPRLSVIHALDQRNTISPEISLNDAKILYNWSCTLGTGALKARVDPSSAIQVTWIDQTANGKWVTDFRLPLVGTPGPLAGDIRVRRQFIF